MELDKRLLYCRIGYVSRFQAMWTWNKVSKLPRDPLLGSLLQYKAELTNNGEGSLERTSASSLVPNTACILSTVIGPDISESQCTCRISIPTKLGLWRRWNPHRSCCRPCEWQSTLSSSSASELNIASKICCYALWWYSDNWRVNWIGGRRMWGLLQGRNLLFAAFNNMTLILHYDWPKPTPIQSLSEKGL